MDTNIKNKIKSWSKRILKIGLVIPAIVIIILAASVYKVKLFDGTFEEDDWSNTQYGANQYMGGTSIGSDGKISTNMTAQELWDKLMEEDSRVDLYLDGPEELLKLMNAQMVTQYLDTRPNPDEPIDWKAISDINSNNVQGIIKLKRAQADGSTITMTYADPETFQTYIDTYNSSGAESDKNEALSHFTLERGVIANTQGNSGGNAAKVNSLDGMLFIGDSITNGLNQAHTSTYWLTNENIKLLENSLFSAENSTYAHHWLQRLDSLPDTSQVKSVCVLLGVNNPTSQNEMKQLIDKLAEKYSGKNIYIQKVFPVGQNGSGFSYTPDEMNSMIQTYNADIQQYCETKQNVYFIDTTDGFVTAEGYLKDDKSADGVHLTDYNGWVENIVEEVVGNDSDDSDKEEEDDDKQEDNNTTQALNDDVLCWPVDSTTITSKFGNRDAPTAGASSYHPAIDIAAPMGSPIYAAQSGTVEMADYTTYGGYTVTINHGNGYTTTYKHNSQLLVSAGDTVEKGQTIAKAGSTGISTGPHLHFEIRYNGNPVDPLGFKYNNNMGSGTAGITGNGSSGGVSTEVTYYAKVATWSEVTDTVESDDPDVESYSTTTYSMTTTKVNYQSLVSAYTMPFDYLWALLVISEDQSFVLDLADLVYNSEIEITVHDNLSINTNVNTYTYTENEKIISKNVSIIGETSEETLRANPGGTEEKVKSLNRTVIHTTITKTNTLDVSLTKADVWIVKYTKDYAYEVPQAQQTQGGAGKLKDIPYTDTPHHTTNTDDIGFGESQRQIYHNQWIEQYPEVVTSLAGVQCDYYYSTTNRNESITNTLERKNYVAPPKGNVEEKTDKNSPDPNFVTILLDSKNTDAKHNLLGTSAWLFELLKINDSTADTFVDLTKYLFYKATTNPKYWDPDEEFDFSIFDPDNFQNNSGGTSGIDGIPGQMYDFLLQKGVPPVGAAAILGNSERESTFNPTAVNNSSGTTGLFQWLGDRLTNLKNFASSKGKDWSDVQTQIEFMWQELNTSYTSVKDVIMSATDESDMEYATWYFARYFEVAFIGSWPASKGQSTIRYQNAQKWYAKWQQSHTSGSVGTNGKGTVYYQGDYDNIPYGTGSIADCGCGPTVFAMIASDYTGKQITPADAVAWCGNAYYIDGQGTSWSYFEAAAKHFNLPCKVVDLGNDINKAINYVKSGNLVISSQDPGLFTPRGHFIILSSIDNNEGIWVRDPNKYNAINKGFNNRAFTASEISASGKNYWAFVK